MQTLASALQPARIDLETAPHRLTIGLFSDDFFFHVPIALLRGAEAIARQYDVNLVYAASDALCSPQDFQIQSNIFYDLIGAENVDALVLATNLIGGFAPFEVLVALYQRYRELPVVSLGGVMEGMPSVVLDNAQGMYEAVSHLIEAHGLRRIAFINGPPEHPDALERYQAYARSMADHGLPIDPKLVLPGDFQSPAGQAAIGLLLNERQCRPGRDVDAIVAANDHMALSAMLELQSRQFRIPEDVAVVGFDNHPAARALTPLLTTVHAPFEEVARKSVELVLAQMTGETVPMVTAVPARQVVRQSCGCTTSSEEVSRGATALPEELRHIFVADPKTALLRLNQDLQTPRDMLLWERALTVLRQYAPMLRSIPTENCGPVAAVAHDACTALLHTAYLTFKDTQYNQLKEQTGHALISTIDLEEITQILATRLPQLGIRHGYLALYDDPPPFLHPQTTPEWSHLHLAYTSDQRFNLPPEGLRFRSRQLLPAEVLPQNGRYTLITIALYFQREQIGFMVLDSGARDESVYLELQAQISSSLQGVLLVRRAQERSAEVIRQKYILDTFMASVPDSIYFKDRQSRITHANQAHARTFGLQHPAEELGKSDFDFFPEDQARPKYDQEQEIMRTGQPLLALEEPDARGRWSLTTKMPLRDEHGEVIGTFGISRDITELKNAQEALVQAYSEISVLNTQLQEENVRMSAELDVVKQLQQMILPRPEELRNIPGLEIAGYMQPADEVGGDYYDVLHDHGLLHIGIGDVTGHGLESGVLMLMTQAAIRTLIEHGETDPIKFVNTLNRLIYKNAQRIGTDKNLTFALVQYQQGQFKLVGQHEEILVVRQNGQIERMNTMDLGFPVGLEVEIRQWVKSATITLQPGDGIVLYTDGITEAENDAGELYGLDRLCAVVSQHWQHSADAIKQAVVNDVMAYIGTHKIYDDITLVVLKQQ